MNTKTHSPAALLRKPVRYFSATALPSALIAIAALATTPPAARAQTAPAEPPSLAASSAPIELEAYVVSASRTQQNIKLTPSSVTSLALSEMGRIQIPDLRTALQLVPGVNASETGGGIGSMTSINIRGASTSQTLFLIDGIRMNSQDSTSGYGNYLGSAGLNGLERLEILRGPQSTLYGSAAMGGVISLETARGNGPAHGTVAIDGGSFNSFGANASVAGSAPLTNNISATPQTLGYSAALSAFHTDNDRDYNTIKQISGSTRIEYQLADRLAVGFTYRGLRSNYEEPGPAYAYYPSKLDLNIDIATLYADWKPISTFETRLVYGWVQNIYDSANPDGSFPYLTHSTRNVIDWQNTWQALEQLQLVAGLNAEWSLYNYDSDGLDYSERLVSAYINAVANPIKNLELTLGIRGDDYSTFSSHATWRAGASYRVEETHTTIRATYGTGFNAPSPQYIYGGGLYYVASPGLKPEKSKGWDIGIEQDLWRDRITIGATYFQNDFDDKFGFMYDASWKTLTYNIPEARSKGLETYIYARPINGLNVQFAYTYLDSRDNAGSRLPRQPRHNLSADINYQFTKELLVGAGLNWISGRSIDSVTNPVVMPDYTTVRLYGSYEVCKNLKLKLRIENLFDKKYEPVYGYPGLPLGIHGGLEWKF